MHCEWNYGPGKVGIGHDLVKGSGHASGEPRQQ
jgi:hypothetical protein